ncbi:hypothetical protein [Roseivirga sp.]|uniref:hypothetical protein n=1 Tax=Roseivirga sp. TaxID=1964215 RepID=UPI003B8B7858
MSEPTKNKFSKSDIASMLAVVLSIAALGIGIIEAKIMADQQEIMADQQRVMVEQQKGSAWPYLAVESELNSIESNTQQMDSIVFSWSAKNKGVGPAIVSDMNLTIHEKPYNSFKPFVDLMDSLIGDENYNLIKFGLSRKTETVYAPGEEKVLFQITFYNKDLFFKEIGFFGLKLKYCSIYGDCWGQNGTPLEEITD